jgi:fructoselysine-6-P-deglycase FrlB-like protein
MSIARPARPLTPLPDDYVTRIQTAVDGNDRVDALIRSVADGGLRNVFLVGCGGSLFSFGALRNAPRPRPGARRRLQL